MLVIDEAAMGFLPVVPMGWLYGDLGQVCVAVMGSWSYDSIFSKL